MQKDNSQVVLGELFMGVNKKTPKIKVRALNKQSIEAEFELSHHHTGGWNLSDSDYATKEFSFCTLKEAVKMAEKLYPHSAVHHPQ